MIKRKLFKHKTCFFSPIEIDSRKDFIHLGSSMGGGKHIILSRDQREDEQVLKLKEWHVAHFARRIA